MRNPVYGLEKKNEYRGKNKPSTLTSNMAIGVPGGNPAFSLNIGMRSTEKNKTGSVKYCKRQ